MKDPLNQIRTEQPFKFSRSNITFSVVVFLGWLALLLLARPQSSFAMGEWVGTLLGILLFPAFVAWIVWLISRRSASALSITFNICLALAVVGQFSNATEKGKKFSAMNDLKSEMDDLKEAFASDDLDVDAMDGAKQEYYAKVRKTFKDLASSTSGKESEFYRTMLELTVENQNADLAWDASFNPILDETILDYSVLTTRDEIARQVEVIQVYASESAKYRKFFIAMPERAAKALQVFGSDYELSIGALRGVRKSYDKTLPLMDPCLEAHAEYGNLMIEVLDLLDAKFGKWTYENENIVFDNDDGLERFNQLMELIEPVETTITDLSNQLLQSM